MLVKGRENGETRRNSVIGSREGEREGESEREREREREEEEKRMCHLAVRRLLDPVRLSQI